MARFEVCAHRWADFSEPDYGVALLNDSKYGYSVYDNVMRLSLLRSPKMPDPQADMGQHHFRYALFPHADNPLDAGVIEEGYRFNSPLLVLSDPGRTPKPILLPGFRWFLDPGYSQKSGRFRRHHPSAIRGTWQTRRLPA